MNVDRPSTDQQGQTYNQPTSMVDNLRPSQTNQTNTVFLEQRALNPQPAQQQNIMTMPKAIESEMADDNWQARQQLMKPVLAKQYAWSASDGAGTLIAELNFPDMLVDLDSLMTRTLQMYAFFKMSPVFRFQLNATQFHQGQIICSFDPFSMAVTSLDGGQNDFRPYYNRYYATGLPNVKIMASESNPVELEIPFVHPRNYLTTNSVSKYDRLGTLRITVLNQLKPATGSTTSLTLSMWIYARDANVHVPMYYHDLLLERPEFETHSLVDLLGTGADVIGNVLSGNMGQAISKGLGGVSSLLGLQPGMGSSTGSVPGMPQLQQCASNFMDYPAPPAGPEKNISPLENMAVSVGVSRAQRLALHPTSGHIVKSEVTASSQDNSDILQIARTPMMFDQITWSTSDNMGSLLYTIPVYPAYFYKTQLTDYHQPTYLLYVSSAFTYWRGGIRIDLEFVATRFHSGKLLIAFVPNVAPSAPTFAQVSQNNPCISVDLQQTSSASFVVPYVSATPYKVMTPEGNPQFDDECTLGTVYIFVQNSLACASNVSGTIDINLYARGAEDFELAVPNFQDNAPYVKPKLVMGEFETHSSTDIKIQTDRTTNVDDPQTAVLTTGSGTTNVRTLFPEDYSIYSLVKRYSKVFQSLSESSNNRYVASTGISGDTQYWKSVFPVAPLQYQSVDTITIPAALNTSQYISWFAFWAQLFSAWSGSIRYKIVTTESRVSQYSLIATGIPDDVTDYNIRLYSRRQVGNTQGSGLAMVRTNLAQDNSLEVEVPFYTPYNMLVMRSPYDHNDPNLKYPNNAGWLAVYANDYQDNPTSIDFELYHAAGEDFRFIYLRPPPCYFGNSYSNIIPFTPPFP